jgi:hypothetical protein
MLAIDIIIYVVICSNNILNFFNILKNILIKNLT